MMMESRNRSRGFTLMELLIVVAIIAVLVAIGIPIYNLTLQHSREAVDRANCRSALSLASAEVASDGTYDYSSRTAGEWATFVEQGGIPARGKAEEGSVLTATIGDDGHSIVFSYVAGPSTEDAITGIADAILKTKKLSYDGKTIDIYSFFLGNNVSSHSVDSTAPAELYTSGKTSGANLALNQYLKEQLGLDTSKVSYRVVGKARTTASNLSAGKLMVYWTDTSIASVAAGTSVQVTRYDVATKTYTTGTAKVKASTYKGVTYNIIDDTTFQAS